MEPVYQRTARDLEQLKIGVETLRNSGAVTWWSADELRTWSARPWNKDGKLLPLVHNARVRLEVKFKDFQALSHWVGQATQDVGGFRLDGVEWALTSQRRASLIAQARTRAVKDAIERAQQYSDALGLGKVRPVSVADAGMLEQGLRPVSDNEVAHLRAGASGAPAIELVPNHIELSAAVDARFAAEIPFGQV
jgi:predicted secreted protein